MIEAKKVMLKSGLLSRGKGRVSNESKSLERVFPITCLVSGAREQLKTVRVWSMFRIPLYFGIFIPTFFVVAKLWVSKASVHSKGICYFVGFLLLHIIKFLFFRTSHSSGKVGFQSKCSFEKHSVSGPIP